MKAHFKYIIEQLERELGLDALLDEEGTCALRFDGKITVELSSREESPHLIQCFAVLGQYHPDNELAVLRDLAAANFAWVGTGGATLGVNLDNHHVMACYPIDLHGIDWPKFLQILEGFVSTCFHWHEHLHKPMVQVDAPPADWSPHWHLRA